MPSSCSQAHYISNLLQHNTIASAELSTTCPSLFLTVRVSQQAKNCDKRTQALISRTGCWPLPATAVAVAHSLSHPQASEMFAAASYIADNACNTTAVFSCHGFMPHCSATRCLAHCLYMQPDLLLYCCILCKICRKASHVFPVGCICVL